MQSRTKAVLILMAAFFCIGSVTAKENVTKAGSARRPNILLVIADDIGMDVTSNLYPGMIETLAGKYGPAGLNHADYRKIEGKPASTPVLDKLASQGMRFGNIWAHPFCSPTRAAILTGLFAAKTKVVTYADALSPPAYEFRPEIEGRRRIQYGRFREMAYGRIARQSRRTIPE